MTKDDIKIRECASVEDFDGCVRLQKEAFALADLEISPRRHLIVTKHAGGFTLGAFSGDEIIGFVLSVPAFNSVDERIFYSHIAAVKPSFQNRHVGARLKWAQRTRALRDGVKFIKWTFQPTQARNAFFNLERLGVVIKRYAPNFYGTDYATASEQNKKIGLDSDRLFAEWNLESEKVTALSNGEKFIEAGKVIRTIEIPNDWNDLLNRNPEKAAAEQTRVKADFQAAFAENLVCRRFERDERKPEYLLYKN